MSVAAGHADLRHRAVGVVRDLVGRDDECPGAVLAAAAIAFYVFIYTMGLKRRTPRTSSGVALQAASRYSSAGPR